MQLGIAGFRFEDLYAPAGLKRLHEAFVTDLTRHYGRPPDTLTADDLEASLIHLRYLRQLQEDSLGTVVTALRFVYYATHVRPRTTCVTPINPSSTTTASW